MDAWIRNLMKSVSSSGSGSASRRDEPEILLCKRRSASPAVVVVAASASATTPAAVSTSAPRSAGAASSQAAASQQTPSPRTQHRIAHWDKKREKCKNCSLIYLKTLSRHPGFCSVDCKSNATYLDKVNRTIRAMKDAVEQRQQQQQDTSAADEPVVEDAPVAAAVAAPAAAAPVSPEEDDAEDDGCERAPLGAHTFSEFGLESRILDASNVEWAFSALY